MKKFSSHMRLEESGHSREGFILLATLAFDVFGQLYDVFGQRYLCNISRSFLNIEITVTLATGTG